MSVELLPAHGEHGFWHLFTLCLAGEPWTTPASLSGAWSLSPVVVLPLLLLLVVFSRDAAAGDQSGVSRRRGAWFAAGWLLLVVALVSPLCRLSATLASVHMVQFMVLSNFAALCLAMGRTEAMVGRALGNWLPRPRKGSSASGLGLTTAAFGAAVWVWHAPGAYEAILTNVYWHGLGFLALILLSVRFWSQVVEGLCRRPGQAIAAVAVTMLHTGLLGALLTFAPRPLYPLLAEGAPAWHLSALEDQQLAGLIMWVGGSASYLAVTLGLLASWLQESAEPGYGSH